MILSRLKAGKIPMLFPNVEIGTHDYIYLRFTKRKVDLYESTFLLFYHSAAMAAISSEYRDHDVLVTGLNFNHNILKRS